jgi:hypothetical protein
LDVVNFTAMFAVFISRLCWSVLSPASISFGFGLYRKLPGQYAVPYCGWGPVFFNCVFLARIGLISEVPLVGSRQIFKKVQSLAFTVSMCGLQVSCLSSISPSILCVSTTSNICPFKRIVGSGWFSGFYRIRHICMALVFSWEIL